MRVDGKLAYSEGGLAVIKCWLSGVKCLEVVSSENCLYCIVTTGILMFLKIAARIDLKFFTTKQIVYAVTGDASYMIQSLHNVHLHRSKQFWVLLC